MARLANEKSGRLLEAFGDESGLTARERLRRAVFHHAGVQRRAPLHIGKYVIAGTMVLLWALPSVALSVVQRFA